METKLVIKEVLPERKHGFKMVRCVCECGKEVIARLSAVNNGYIKSCGCIRKKHGLSDTLTYSNYQNMIHRCLSDSPRRRDYTLKGIQVCSRWKESILNFIEDMGERPGLKYSVDRIDVNGHYSCGHCEECLANEWKANCRWATPSEQASNKDKSKTSSYHKGISYYKSRKNWEAYIFFNKKKYRIGYFNTEKEAVDAREAWVINAFALKIKEENR